MVKIKNKSPFFLTVENYKIKIVTSTQIIVFQNQIFFLCATFMRVLFDNKVT